jgi:YggT family protein
MSGMLLIIITTLANVLTILIIVDTLLSWVLQPFHPIRAALGRVLQPLYTPIRRVIPPLGMMDISPLVLLLLVQVIAQIAASILG